ncbi:MAG TPA: GNAT family N-acetyltransferase [Candidatus Limnocylindrales bacterium]|nr:GNAT family N-acetyltransferase [Candidatus Limnocylindrales bacterium]
MAHEALPDLNLFMICRTLRREAPRGMPEPYRLRSMRPDELGTWKAMPFDDAATAAAFDGFMEEWAARVYRGREAEFHARTLFAVDPDDRPVGTCMLWDAYGRLPTIHWLKVMPALEGKGIGRALLSAVLRDLDPGAYPVYLHTQPESARAVALYTDFGFDLLAGERFGTRTNDLEASLPILRELLPPALFARLRIAEPPPEFVAFMATTTAEEF